MQLVKPSLEYKDSFIEAVKEGVEDSFFKELNIEEVEKDFDKYVQNRRDNEKGINLKQGYVPATDFWLVDNGDFIGRVSVRHKLNDNLLKTGGHIGYGIRRSKRKMGYGTKILEFGLKEAKDLGIDRVLVTCDDDNVGSVKIIEKNGGVLENKIEHDDKKITRRYWIDIK